MSVITVRQSPASVEGERLNVEGRVPFSRTAGVKHVRCVNSGSDALKPYQSASVAMVTGFRGLRVMPLGACACRKVFIRCSCTHTNGLPHYYCRPLPRKQWEEDHEAEGCDLH